MFGSSPTPNMATGGYRFLPVDTANDFSPGPHTPHGKTLLSKNLGQLNLPPEEWATEVKELNGQLVECLEQLYEREEELEEQRSTVSSLEENLVRDVVLLTRYLENLGPII